MIPLFIFILSFCEEKNPNIVDWTSSTKYWWKFHFVISNLEQWCILNRIWCDDGFISIHEFSAHLAVHSTQLGSTHTTTTTRTTMTTTTMTRRRRRSVPFLFTSFPPTWQCTLPNLDQPICSQKYVDLSQDNTSARDFLPQNIWDILGN